LDKLSKHDTGVMYLSKMIEDEYDHIIKNLVVYSNKDRMIAEADLIAFKDGYADIYEVKCSYRPTKAKRQLRKLKKALSPKIKVRNTYFFPMNVDQIILLSI
jgi:hypothetical protein